MRTRSSDARTSKASPIHAGGRARPEYALAALMGGSPKHPMTSIDDGLLLVLGRDRRLTHAADEPATTRRSSPAQRGESANSREDSQHIHAAADKHAHSGDEPDAGGSRQPPH